jgi:hypothetical protein
MSYSYLVRATDGAGNLGAISNVASVMTLSTNPQLVAVYSFDEGTGTSAADLSGKGNTGTIVNGTWVAGKYGSALAFNGASTRVTIPDASSLRLTTAMTLEAWVNPSITSSVWRDVIYKGDDNYYLTAASTVNGVPAVGATLGSSGSSNVFGSVALPVNSWTHLAATYDGTAVRLFVNGAQVASLAKTGGIATSSNPLEIGSDHLYGQYFQGAIDEIRLYNVALTPTQIQADMNSPTGGSTPAVSLSPTNLDFGTQATGTTSGARTATLTNVGGAPLSLGGIAVSGPNSTEFAQTNTCGA